VNSPTPPPLDEPPPRQPWEEPPPNGWASHLGNVGLEVALFAISVGVALVGARVLSAAERMGRAPQLEGTRLAVVVALWAAACMIGALLIVYVWRRLGGLFLVGAMLTDMGRGARLRGRPPVFLDHKPPPGNEALSLVHLSDLHIVEQPRVRLVERRVAGGNARLEAILDATPLDDTDLLVITGDVTDRGTAIAWRSFLEILDERGLAERTLLVPGNHDLALLELLDRADRRARRRAALRADRFSIVQLANLLKFAEAFTATYGGRHGFVLSDDGDDIVPWEDAFRAVERRVRPLLQSLAERPAPTARLRHYFRDRAVVDDYARPIDEAHEALARLFPVAVPVAGRDAVVFVLNSVTSRSRHPATNAIGRIGRLQYRRLDRLARFFGQALRLVALHHHVVRRPEEAGLHLRDRLIAKLTVLGDPRPLLRFCRREGVRAVLHGHRHLSYQLRLPDGTVLLAAPSSTLGDELAHDPRAHVERYTFAARPESVTCGIHREVTHPE
jgi:3',5'-cyclic AMP phosphodiesterase CpdA